MYRLAFRVALACVVATGVASRALPATASSEGPRHGPHQALISGLPVPGAPAAVRAGSAPSPEQDAQALAFAGGPAIPRPTAVATATYAREAVAPRLVELLHPQRGPPPSHA